MQDKKLYINESEPYVVRKSRKLRKIYYGRIIFCVFLLCGGLIIVSLMLAFDTSKIVIQPKSFYYAGVGSFENAADAARLANNIKVEGGSGYVYNNGVFRVSAAVFTKKSDCEIVVKRLNDKGTNATIYEFILEKKSIKVYEDKTVTNKVKDGINNIFQKFDELYEINNKLSTREFSESLALNQITKIYENLERTKNEISLIAEDKTIIALLKMYDEALLTLKTVLEISFSENIMSKVKYSVCEYAYRIGKAYELL